MSLEDKVVELDRRLRAAERALEQRAPAAKPVVLKVHIPYEVSKFLPPGSKEMYLMVEYINRITPCMFGAPAGARSAIAYRYSEKFETVHVSETPEELVAQLEDRAPRPVPERGLSAHETAEALAKTLSEPEVIARKRDREIAKLLEDGLRMLRVGKEFDALGTFPRDFEDLREFIVALVTKLKET